MNQSMSVPHLASETCSVSAAARDWTNVAVGSIQLTVGVVVGTGSQVRAGKFNTATEIISGRVNGQAVDGCPQVELGSGGVLSFPP